MRVGYKSQSDKLHIDFVDAARSDYGDDSIPLTVVAVVDEAPIYVDLLEVSTHGCDAQLRAVAEKYGLDPAELIAAGRAAYETPDRIITLEFAKAA